MCHETPYRSCYVISCSVHEPCKYLCTWNRSVYVIINTRLFIYFMWSVDYIPVCNINIYLYLISNQHNIVSIVWMCHYVIRYLYVRGSFYIQTIWPSETRILLVFSWHHLLFNKQLNQPPSFIIQNPSLFSLHFSGYI